MATPSTEISKVKKQGSLITAEFIPSKKPPESEPGRVLTAATISRESVGSKIGGAFTTTTGSKKILRSKTRETFTTETDPRKMLEYETRDVKKDKEKITQSSWELTYGRQDYKELLLFEENMGFVIYEKRISKTIAPLSKSSPSDLETKKGSERQKQQLLKILLCRTEVRSIKNLESLADYSGRSLTPLLIPTGKRPLTIFMLFGDGHKVDEARQKKGWELFDSSFLELDRVMNIPLGHYTQHFSFPPDKGKAWKNAQKAAKFLKKIDSLDTDTFLGITIGDISESLCKGLFDTLNKEGWFNIEDCTFLKRIAPFRGASRKQEILLMQIRHMVTKPEPSYKEAMALTKKIHRLSRKEAYTRGTSSVYMNQNRNNIEVYLIDDCHAAFKLGKHLEKRGLLEDAVEAFKILTDNVVNTTGKVSVTYHSFYADKARSKIEKFQKPSITSSFTIDSESEKLREKIIEENVTGLIQGGDVNIDLLLNSLKIHCGFSSESNLLKNVDKKGKHEEILSKVILNMATTICQQRSELLLLQRERKERVEAEMGSQSTEVIRTKPVEKAASKLLKAEVFREEDNDENFPPTPPDSPTSFLGGDDDSFPLFPTPLHFAYSRPSSNIKKSMSSPPEAEVWKAGTFGFE